MIPVELTQYRQWVCWRYETDSSGKPTKVPYNPIGANKADTTNPNDWVDYATVTAAMQSGHYSGIGFVLSHNDPYTFIDLDNPYADTTFDEAQAIAARHARVLQMMDSYAEWSPSGKGMHIIVRGKVADGRRRRKIEVYSHSRYMTMTGNTYLDKPIADRSDILQQFHAELGKPDVNVVVRDSPQTHSDAEVWERMTRAENGEKALATWQGEWQGLYASHSECDQALINFLQFYTHNAEQIARMFMASPCAARLRSGEKHKHKNYLRDMIRKSFDRELPDIDFSALRKVAEQAIATEKAHSNGHHRVVPIPAPTESEITFPPGLVGEIAQFIYDQAPLPVREVALAAALGLMAGVCGRAYNVTTEGLNMYILLLALTGIGKEAAAKGTSKLLDRVEALAPAVSAFRGPAEIASGPALTKYLAKDSPCCFSLLGEFGLRLHQMCNDQAQSHMIGLRRVLLELFHKSGRGASLRPHVYSDKEKNTEVLYSPAFTILGESTPDMFYRHLDESMLTDGLLPRFLIIEYTGDRGRLNRDFASVEPSNQLVQRFSELATFCIQMQHSSRVLDCQFTPDAMQLYWELADYYTDLINKNRDNNVARQLYNRAHLKIMKVAALIAVGCNPIQPTITVDFINWARALIDRDVANILRKFEMGKVGRETGDLNQIEELTEVIKSYMVRSYDGAVKKLKVPVAMKEAGIVPYQYIQRMAAGKACFRQDRSGSTFAINRAIQALIYEGVLREIKPVQLQNEFQTSMKAYAIIDPTLFS